jgi:hypothetical protein
LHFRYFISRPGRHFVEAAHAVNNLWLNRDQGGVSEALVAAKHLRPLPGRMLTKQEPTSALPSTRRDCGSA